MGQTTGIGPNVRPKKVGGGKRSEVPIRPSVGSERPCPERAWESDNAGLAHRLGTGFPSQLNGFESRTPLLVCNPATGDAS